MASTTEKSYFWLGVREGAPFILMAAPFGLLFGVLATEAGLSVAQTITFSASVFAGAAQFTALQLMQEQAPTLIVILSALAVNLRVAMYSAALTPYLGAAPLGQRILVAYFTVDQSYACSSLRFEKEPDMTVPQRVRYFIGTIAHIMPIWFAASYLGAVVGARIPESWALDFAVPITFLAMIGPMLRSTAHVVAALVAIVVALLSVGVPYNLGLLIAGGAGMMAGARVELMMRKAGG